MYKNTGWNTLLFILNLLVIVLVLVDLTLTLDPPNTFCDEA
jgi:hypothetical protein